MKISSIISSLYVCRIVKTTLLFSVDQNINNNNDNNNNESILC